MNSDRQSNLIEWKTENRHMHNKTLLLLLLPIVSTPNSVSFFLDFNFHHFHRLDISVAFAGEKGKDPHTRMPRTHAHRIAHQFSIDEDPAYAHLIHINKNPFLLAVVVVDFIFFFFFGIKYWQWWKWWQWQWHNVSDGRPSLPRPFRHARHIGFTQKSQKAAGDSYSCGQQQQRHTRTGITYKITHTRSFIIQSVGPYRSECISHFTLIYTWYESIIYKYNNILIVSISLWDTETRTTIKTDKQINDETQKNRKRRNTTAHERTPRLRKKIVYLI